MSRRTLQSLPRILGGAVLAVASVVALPAQAIVLDFSDRLVGDTFNVGGGFTTGGVDVTGSDFTFSGGTTTGAGFARVDGMGFAGGIVPDMEVNNILAVFDLSPFGFVDQVSFLFGEFGGNINLAVNGALIQNLNDFTAGLFGGVNVSVGAGVVTLSTPGVDITSVGIGGQELWIDDVRFDPRQVVSEPATVLLLGLGGLAMMRRRRAASNPA